MGCRNRWSFIGEGYRHFIFLNVNGNCKKPEYLNENMHGKRQLKNRAEKNGLLYVIASQQTHGQVGNKMKEKHFQANGKCTSLPFLFIQDWVSVLSSIPRATLLEWGTYEMPNNIKFYFRNMSGLVLRASTSQQVNITSVRNPPQNSLLPGQNHNWITITYLFCLSW